MNNSKLAPIANGSSNAAEPSVSEGRPSANEDPNGSVGHYIPPTRSGQQLGERPSASEIPSPDYHSEKYSDWLQYNDWLPSFHGTEEEFEDE